MDSVGTQAAPPTGAVAFDRKLRGLNGIVVEGVLLSFVTFGIYRFWYMTNLRRYFWSRTVVAGSPAEYTGTGKELFVGFVLAMVLLAGIFVGTGLLVILIGLVSPTLGGVVGALTPLLPILLAPYALYRGRRYRASRTLWRGIRLGQGGRAETYALMSIGWWLLTILTLGLAFPFMRASLERYRIGHTLVGTSRMRSTATGGMVIGPWLTLYAVGLVPLILVGAAILFATGFSVSDLMVQKPGGGPDAMTINPAYAGTRVTTLLIALPVIAGICLPLALLLFPFYRAREVRAFLNAASLDDIRLISTLRARAFYWPYLRFVLVVLGVALVPVMLGLVTALLGRGLAGSDADVKNAVDGLVALAIGLGAFAAAIGGLLLVAVLKVRVIQAGLWGAVARSTAVSDPDRLAAIAASARPVASGLQEGLADALDVGGALQIGF